MKKLFLGCLALLLPIAAVHAAIPPVERLLPDDTLVVVSTPDFQKLRQSYEASPQSQLWNDPAMKPFKDSFLARLKEEFVAPLERDLGVSLDNYASLPQGQLTFAITQNGWKGPDGPSPAFLLLLDAKEKSQVLRTNLAELRRKWLDSGKSVRTERIRDIEFAIFPAGDSDVPKTLKKFFGREKPEGEGWDTEDETNRVNEIVIGQFESLLIAGTSVRAVERIAVRLTGGSMPALADLASFEQNRISVFRESPLFCWVNVKGFFDVVSGKTDASDADEAPFAMFEPEKILRATGVGGLKTVSVSFQSSPEGSLMHLFASVPESTRQGLLKVFATEARDSGPPPFVPSDAVKFQRMRIDGQKAWSALQQSLSDLSPQLLEGLKFMLETAESAAKQKDPDFNIEKSLFGNLGDDMISYEKAPVGTTQAALENPPSMFMLASPRPDQLAAALKSLLVFFSQPGTTPGEREFLGRKIYSVPLAPAMGSRSGPGNRGQRRTLNYAASGGYVAITSDATLLEEFLRSSEGSQKALRDTPGLIEAAAKTGGMGTGVFGYENRTETARTFFDALRQQKSGDADLSSLLGLNFPGGAAGFKELMDFSLLPPYERISKYFYFDVYSFGSNVDGLTLRMFSPTPPELRK